VPGARAAAIELDLRWSNAGRMLALAGREDPLHRLIPIVFLFLVAPLVAASPADARSNAERADSLHHSAQLRLAEGTVDARRIAIDQLDQAMRLDPLDPRHPGALGRACLEAGSDHRALDAFHRVLELAPDDADAHLGIALAWKREWLAGFEPSFLDSARRYAEAAFELHPDGCAERVLAALLAYEKGDVAHALELGRPASAVCPERYEAGLLSAEFAWRIGAAALADSLFATWIPSLPPVLRERFEQTTPLLTEVEAGRIEGLSPEARTESIRRFWSQSDPDPTTDRNEARLEYWARVAHASLLFMDLERARWDIRGELYSRYGAPNALRYEPMGYPLAARHNDFDHFVGTALNGVRRIGEPLWVPLHSMVLEYPELGMRVLLHDPYLNNTYDVPVGRSGSNDPLPSPAALANPDLVATPGARGVFPLHPPGVAVIPVAAAVSGFQDVRGPRLFAQVEAPGSPDDSLWAEAVVIDSSEHVIARSSTVMAPSACDPAATRASEFDFPLMPGPHRVAIAVHDRTGARGLARMFRDVAPLPGTLAISDIVVSCGSPASMTNGAQIRLQPNVARAVNGDDPLVAYFEVYNLASGAGGTTRFEYVYTIRPEREARRGWFARLLGGSDPGTRVRSQSEGRESIRRQFILAPTRSLPGGSYTLEVEVHDLNSGTKTVGTARFVKT
jgi:GWxTD domain-containing protein